MIKKERVMELLEDGAEIELTKWGFDYPVYLRHSSKKIFDKIHKATFNSLKQKKLLKLVKQEMLDYVYKLVSNHNDKRKNYGKD